MALRAGLDRGTEYCELAGRQEERGNFWDGNLGREKTIRGPGSLCRDSCAAEISQGRGGGSGQQRRTYRPASGYARAGAASSRSTRGGARSRDARTWCVVIVVVVTDSGQRTADTRRRLAGVDVVRKLVTRAGAWLVHRPLPAARGRPPQQASSCCIALHSRPPPPPAHSHPLHCHPVRRPLTTSHRSAGTVR